LLLSLVAGTAQVTVDITLDQEQYLRDESMPVKVRITNRSGRTLKLGGTADWLNFTVENREGHNVGDASLRRFADVLQEEFPDAHAVLRFAGDEFLAIVPRQPSEVIEQRIAHIRQRLGADDPASPALRFSVGVRALDAGADPQHALREADLAMYEDKARRRGERAPNTV
jgi:diguanylate cyclase (GGDEF)-like protein